MTTLTIPIPKQLWLSSNARLHRMEVARRTSLLRLLGNAHARDARLPRFEQVHVAAWIQYPTARKADAPNAWPTCKALIDGVVDSGALPDDDSRHVLTHLFGRDPGKSKPDTYRVRLVITDQNVPFATHQLEET